MKKIFVLLAVFMMIIANAAFAEERVLINFGDLIDDAQGEHQATLVDFSQLAGTRFTEEEKAQMRSSLNIPNWGVQLSNSSQSVLNNHLSYVLPVQVNENATRFAGEQVLGMRVHFPVQAFNSYAWIKPPFEIPAYNTNAFDENAVKGDQFTGFGVLKNVGVLKTVKMNVYGLNHPIGIGVVLRNAESEYTEVLLGHMEFDGWRELSWNNPNYISEVRNRTLRRIPLYPRTAPVLVLDSIQVYKDAMKEGGDFIGYVKDITLIYDQAIIQDIDTDLNHENYWGILADREEDRRIVESARLSEREVLRYIEKQKMHQDVEEETVQ